MAQIVNIVHFNDVYNINPIIKKDGDGNITSICGGASRFKSMLNTLSPLNPIVLFSGDFLSPSDMGTVTNGEHMIPVMNTLGITVGMIGNHDLDYGNEHCFKMLSQLNYPTLNTNVFTPTNGTASGLNTEDDLKLDLEPLGKCPTSHVFEFDSLTVGVLGISEDWSSTLPIPPENGTVCIDFVESARDSVAALRAQHDIDLMIVLTHSRLLNDQLLASKVEGIDIICGGHDHSYFCGMDASTKTMILKSGTDFKNVSWLQLQRNDEERGGVDQDAAAKSIASALSKSLNELKGPFVGSTWSFLNRYYNIDGHLAADAATETLVHSLSASFKAQMAQTIGFLAAPIDARFSVVRSRESTAGNFICDVIRRAYHCDGVILCGGALRADRVMSAGPFTYGDILDIVPFQDSIVVLQLKGSSIVKALEHSVSGVPKAEGRFPQIAGIRFLYDPEAAKGCRVRSVWISRYHDEGTSSFQKSFENLLTEDSASSVHGMQPLDAEAVYTVATREYLANGGDGFAVYKEETLETVVDGEAGIPMSLILRNFFWAVSTVNKMMEINRDSQEAQELMAKMDLKPRDERQTMLSVVRTMSPPPPAAMDNDDGAESDHPTEEEEEQKNDDAVGGGGYVDALAITPVLEHRIMTVDEEIDFEAEEWKPMAAHFQRMPSFVNMKRMPTKQTVRDLLAAIDEAEDSR